MRSLPSRLIALFLSFALVMSCTVGTMPVWALDEENASSSEASLEEQAPVEAPEASVAEEPENAAVEAESTDDAAEAQTDDSMNAESAEEAAPEMQENAEAATEDTPAETETAEEPAAEESTVEEPAAEESATEQKEEIEYPELSSLETDGGRAISFTFADEDTAAVEDELGYEVKSAHAPRFRFFARAIANSQYRFDGYYILYENNIATTKTDYVQDLIGNMNPNKQTIKYQLDFHNDTDYEIGDVVIRVPYELYKDRYGAAVLPSDIGVPEAPGISKSSSFNYVIDGDELVFTNCKQIVSGSNNLLQIFYSLDDMATIDGTDWTIEPKITVKGQEGNANIQLTGSMDTRTKLTLTDKIAYEENGKQIYPELYTLNQIKSVLGNVPIPAQYQNLNKYHYILWRTEIKGAADQPWDMTITDTPSDGGVVIGQCIGYKAGLYQTAGDTLTFNNQALYDVYNLVDDGAGSIYVYSVVAYPIDEETGKIGTDNHVKNDITVSMTGVDDEIKHTLTDGAEWTWEPYNWKYVGDMIGVDKFYGGSDEESKPNIIEPSWLTIYEKNKEQNNDTNLPRDWKVHGILRGYDLIYVPLVDGAGNKTGEREDHSADYTYTLTTVDDIQYVKSNIGTYTEMDYRDYYYSSVNVKPIDYGIDIYENELELQTEGLETKIWVMAADQPDDWQLVATVPYADCYKNGYDLPQEWLDKGIYRIKAEHSSNDYVTYCDITGKTALRADSPKVAEVLASEDATRLTVQNMGGVFGTATVKNNNKDYIQDQNTSQYDDYSALGLLEETKKLYGTVLMRDNKTVHLTKLQETNKIVKGGTAVNNPLLSRIDLNYQIGAMDGYTVYRQTGVDFLEDNGFTANRNTVTLYDFLPEGIMFDPAKKVTAGIVTSKTLNDIASDNSNIKSWNTSGVSVSTSVQDDYNGSGRQLVTFTIQCPDVNSASYSDMIWSSYWAVDFGAYYEWKDISSCNGAQNTAAFQTPDAMKGTAFPDDGSGAPLSTDKPGTDTSYISDLDGDGDTTEKNVIYATKAVALDNAVATKAEISKLVKEDANAFGTPEIDASGVECDKTYTYYVKLQNGNNKLSNIVLIDRLEYAPEYRSENDTHSFADNWWYGTFVKTNVDLLRQSGIDVKVYYSTKRDVAYPDKDVYNPNPDTISGYLTSNADWTLSADYTGDMADVKAVAYDLTHNTDGTAFVLEEMDSLSLTIQMRAPDTVQDNPNGNAAAKNPDAPATYAYNNPAYFGTTSVSGGTTSDTTIGNSTSIPLYGATKLSVAKTEIIGEGAPNLAFPFTVMVDGKPYATREYTLYERDENGEWQQVKDGQIRSTDGNGVVKLKEGQKAVFNTVPDGRTYSIQENTGLHWTNTAKDAEGTLIKNTENAAEFTNTYHPLTYFEKIAQYAPSGHTNDTFTFEMYLNGKLAKNQTYYIVDSAVDMKKDPTIQSTLTTDENGRFTIKAKQRICVVQNVGDTWEFREVDMSKPDDYVPVSDTVAGDATVPYASSAITNNYIWKDLIFTKNLTDLQGNTLSSNEVFSFHLTIDGVPYSGAYKLNSTKKTMTDGNFTLKGGEKITVSNIRAGTPYLITEELTDEQKEIYQSSGTASGSLPNFATAGSTSITNKDARSALKISKAMLSDDATATTANAKAFTFTVYIDQNGDGTADEPYGSQNYTLTDTDGTQSILTTAADGTFTLKHGQTAYFGGLASSTAYRVVEADAAGYSHVSPANGIAEGKLSKETPTQEEPFVNSVAGQNNLLISKTVTAGSGITSNVLDAVLNYEGNYFYDESWDEIGYDYAAYYEDSGNDTIETYGFDPMTMLFRVLIDYNDGKGYVPYLGPYEVQNKLPEGTTQRYESTWYCGAYCGENSNGELGVYYDPSFDFMYWNEEDYDWTQGLIPLYPGESAALTGLPDGCKYKVLELQRCNYNPASEKELYYIDPVKGNKITFSRANWEQVSPEGAAEGALNGAATENFTNELSAEMYLNPVGKYVDGELINSLNAEDYPNMVGKQLTYQLLCLNADGSWLPVPNYTYYDSKGIDNGSGMMIRLSETAEYLGKTDEEGKIHLTCTKSDDGTLYLPIILFLLPTDNNSVALTGQNAIKAGSFKLVEVAEETDSAFGTLERYLYYNYDNARLTKVYNTTAPQKESFTVAKQVEGESAPDTTFSFTLTHYYEATDLIASSRTAVAKQAYTLWDDKGTPSDTSDDTQITDGAPFLTDENGVFMLKAGQYAKFEGMDSAGKDDCGPVYRVDETPVDNWSTVVATDGTIYNFNAVVTDVTNATGWIAGGKTNGLTYTNTYKEPEEPQPDLKIRKIVSSGTVSTKFTFTLNVDGVPYADEEYKLYNAATDEEILNTQTIAGVKVTLPWTTDEYGDFQMTVQQYVVFEYLGKGKQYEISETPQTNYVQVQPAAGSNIIGTMPSTGASETFINEKVSTTSGTFKVSKALSWPSGIDLPDDQEFTFYIEVAGSEYAMQSFTTYDSATGNVVSTSGNTDAFGRFTLKAGQYAMFENIATNQDYEVHEQVQDDGGTWYNIDDEHAPKQDYYLAASSGTAGATGKVNVSFTNAEAAFLVGKNVVSSAGDDIPEGDEFTFTLTLGGKTAADQPYWIYDLSGAKTGEGKTDENGQFALTAAQKALFYGIAPGTDYNVKEAPKQHYTQVIPQSGEGFSGSVGDTAPTLTFENDYFNRAALSISKQVTGEDAPADAVFTFLLETGVDDGEGNITYTPYANRAYDVGEQSYRTNANGELTLTANQTAQFKSLPVGTLYRVTEKNLPSGFTQASLTDTGEGVLGEDGENVTVTNNYSKILDIILPTTGGHGLLPFLAIGLMLLLLSSGEMLRRKRKEQLAEASGRRVAAKSPRDGPPGRGDRGG